MKSKLTLVSSLLLCMLFFSSCRKELYSGEEVKKETMSTSERDLLLKEAKEWYESKPEHSKGTRLKESKLNVLQGYIGTPEWDRATFFKTRFTGMPVFVRVPIKDYTVNCSFTKNMAPHGLRELALRKRGDGDFILDIWEWHPDADYQFNKKTLTVAAKNLVIDSKDEAKRSLNTFKGYFLIYTASNDLRYGERQENGRTVSRLAKKE